jgi:hypothetical protein
MSTGSLLRWIALVAGAELAVRGHLADRTWTCHAGAALFALALAALAWPTRAWRAGGIAAGALLALVAIDAAVAGFASPAPAATAPAREAVAPAPPRDPAPVAPGRFAILVFGGRARSTSAASLERALNGRMTCAQPLAVVEAGGAGALGDAAALTAAIASVHAALVLVLAESELLDDVAAESPALDFAAPAAIGPRASPIGVAVESALASWRSDRRWRAALDEKVALDPRSSRVVARYRALVLASRRAGADVALVIPPLALAPDAPRDAIRAAERDEPRARRWLLASRAHARSLRALAGTYGIRAIDVRPGLEGSGSAAFDSLGQLSDAGRAQLAQTVATALADLLARTPPGCR